MQSESRLRVLSILFHVVGHGPPLAPSRNGVKIFLKSHLYFKKLQLQFHDIFPELSPPETTKVPKVFKGYQNGYATSKWLCPHYVLSHRSISRRTSFLV